MYCFIIYVYNLSDEPNNYGGKEDCAKTDGGGKWVDIPCARTLPFVCDKADPSYDIAFITGYICVFVWI